MILVELLDGRLQVRALLALDEQLGNLGAALHVLGAHFSYLALLRAGSAAVAATRALGFDVRRTEGVIGELALVLGLGDFGFAVPELTLLVGHVLPSEADDLRQRAVVRLDLRGDVPTLDKRGTEQDEGIGRARDVVIRLLLSVSWLFGTCAIQS